MEIWCKDEVIRLHWIKYWVYGMNLGVVFILVGLSSIRCFHLKINSNWYLLFDWCLLSKIQSPPTSSVIKAIHRKDLLFLLSLVLKIPYIAMVCVTFFAWPFVIIQIIYCVLGKRVEIVACWIYYFIFVSFFFVFYFIVLIVVIIIIVRIVLCE